MMRPYRLVAPAMPAAQAAPQMGVTPIVPVRTALYAPYPNPSSRGATIRFSLAKEGPADLELYNVAGQRVRRLASGSFAAGERSLVWNGQDETGRQVAAGVYFVRLVTAEAVMSRKLFVAP